MLDNILKNKFFIYVYTTLILLAACFIVITNNEVTGVIIFANLAAITLIISSRFTDAMFPALLLSVFATRCYNSADIFLSKIPYFIPVVVSVILHFLIYRKKYIGNFKRGESFLGLCAVTLAVTFGGIGTISSSEYFSGGALFYVFGLGIGMLILYLLIKANFDEKSANDIVRIMYVIGIFACFCVIRFYIADWQDVIEDKELVVFQSSNNLATFLMLAMPFPMFYASRRYVDILSVFLIYGCTVLSGSRGGIMMGTLELIIILVFFSVFDDRHKLNRFFHVFFAVAFVLTGFTVLPHILSFLRLGENGNDITSFISAIKKNFIESGESRLRLLERMVDDFKRNPIFGSGIGYTGNNDIYSPVKGAMNWYHMWFAQVIGGLGIIGIAAYGYQLAVRVKLFVKSRTIIHLTFFLSYIGLFLMSQVNPGEFCPVPYAALAMTYFTLMESEQIKLISK